jgi:hypothetical protein
MQDNDQRQNLKKDTWIIIVALICVLVFVSTNFGEQQGRYYDCRDAHWHPDVPVEVKKECNRLLHEEMKRIKEEESKKKYITA